MKKHVRTLAGAGFALHRLRPRSKAPYAANWSEAPVLTADEFLRTLKPNDNLGVRLGEPSVVGGYYLHVIDLDIRTPRQKVEAFDKLREFIPNFKTLPCVKSGSGGPSRHYYLLCKKPFRSKKLAHSENKITGADGKKHWAWEIELFGTGKQVALPPSIHPDTGLEYEWVREFDFDALDLDIGPIFPAKTLSSWVNSDGGSESKPKDRESEDLAAIARAQPLELTKKDIREILAGLDSDKYATDRDGWLIVGQCLHHQFQGSEAGFKEWVRFSLQDEDKFDAEDQERVWKSFGARSKPITFRTLIKESGWVKVVDETEDGESADSTDDREPWEKLHDKKKKTRREELIDQFNQEHAFVYLNGKTRILFEGKDDTPPSFSDVQGFHALKANIRIVTEDDSVAVSNLWQKDARRRTYMGVHFDPLDRRKDYYNTWKGFSTEPDPNRSCRRFLKHLKRVVCNDNEEHYEWLIRWFAHILQFPAVKPGTAVVLRGKKGTGKDSVAYYFGEIVKRHYYQISSSRGMIGNFNAHLAKTIFLHAEEATWGGDRSAEGALKSLITAPTIDIEPKGIDKYQIKSYLRIFMSSNEDWVVPASDDERRYFVLDVSDKHMQDEAYFNALREEMDNGGPAALMHFLLNLDLTGFNVRKPPETEGLLRQKLQSLNNVERWWYDILQTGELPSEHSQFEDARDWSREGVNLECRLLRGSYEEYVRNNRFSGSAVSEADFGRRLRAMAPRLKRLRLRYTGSRPWGYSIPSLEECRAAFSDRMKYRMSWDEDSDEEDLLG